MQLSGELSPLKRKFVNVLGWRTKRKIVVIESDDWGMIRMASKNAFNRLLAKGYPVDKCVYSRNDALESNEDVLGLLECLQGVKDKYGNYAKFTLNNIVANPNFLAIRDSGFEGYYFETFRETQKLYRDTDRVFDLYLEGLDKGLLRMQLHGREHININRWLHSLKNCNKSLRDSFDEGMFTVPTGGSVSCRRDYLDSFGYFDHLLESHEMILRSAMSLFIGMWGYTSESFIAPCYVWSPSLENVLLSVGVKYIQGTHVQKIPHKNTHFCMGRKYHYQGQRNKNDQIYLVRNVFFEPSIRPGIDNISFALAGISNAFLNRKPAIISSHRVNYIGRIRSENRSNNLRMLSKLLRDIVRKWPDAEFMTSDELGGLMEKDILCVE
jgi:hypothetical protein